MARFKNVLVATDGSKNSLRAVEAAKSLSATGEYRVSVVHVVQPVIQSVGLYGSYGKIPDLMSTEEANGRRILDEALATLQEAGIEVDTHLVIGIRGREICHLAEKGEYDLIVMGRRGMSRLEEAVLGSVSEYVVRHSKLPVLIVQ